MQEYYANGKLLLSAEYFVLDGAWALGLPTQKGQSLTVKALPESEYALNWTSIDADGSIWLEVTLELPTLNIINASKDSVAHKLSEILRLAQQQNLAFLSTTASLEVTTQLTFPRQWGLGTSSTLIYNVAQWAKIDPFPLQFAAFGGSAYDIACAGAKGPILYQKLSKTTASKAVIFRPSYRNALYFIYLGKKQDTREGIAHYKEKVRHSPQLIYQATAYTHALLNASTLEAFELVLQQHEHLVATTLALEPVKDLYFQDFWGQVKSLGAWGGDFVLATSSKGKANTKAYFKEKGFDVCLTYEELIL